MKSKFNPKVVILSLVALGLLALTYLVNWLFIIPVAVIIWYNYKELNKK